MKGDVVSTLEKNNEILDTLIETAARALFDAQGLPLGPLCLEPLEPQENHDLAASIGFTSAKVQGAILMTTRMALIARAWPRELRDREPTEHEICDCAGELLNQLLGRIKNALAPLGLVLAQSTPTVVVGKHVHRAPPLTNVARRYCFDVGGATLLVYFDAAVADGVALSGVPSRGPEGEVHLF